MTVSISVLTAVIAEAALIKLATNYEQKSDAALNAHNLQDAREFHDLAHHYRQAATELTNAITDVASPQAA